MPDGATGGLEAVGRVLLVVGGLIVLAGLACLGLGRLGWHLRPLPGDIVIRRPGIVIYFPIVTMLILSILFTLIMRFISYLRH